LRDRVEGFANKVNATIDRLDFGQRQKLLRLLVDEVRVKGWQVEIRLSIPLDEPPGPPAGGVSSKDRLRSLSCPIFLDTDLSDRRQYGEVQHEQDHAK